MSIFSSELRKDYIQDKYVIVAPAREERPGDHKVNYELYSHQERRSSSCVFCPNKLELKSASLIVGGRSKWSIVVVPNKYPAVSLHNPKAYGQQEVVIETPKHGEHLEDMSLNQINQLLAVYAQRTTVLATNKKIEYILIFKNNGGKAGASIHHSHSQIFATSFLPPHLLDKSQRVQAYKLKTGRCVYCDVIKKEKNGSRLVYLDNQAIAFTPYASMYQYELWIMPRRHLDNVTNLSIVERRSLAQMLKRSLTVIAHRLKLPYNYYFHQVIKDEDQHLYLKITPRGSVWAGVEIGSGLIINPVTPEAAAKFYRQRL